MIGALQYTAHYPNCHDVSPPFTPAWLFEFWSWDSVALVGLTVGSRAILKFLAPGGNIRGRENNNDNINLKLAVE